MRRPNHAPHADDRSSGRFARYADLLAVGDAARGPGPGGCRADGDGGTGHAGRRRRNADGGATSYFHRVTRCSPSSGSTAAANCHSADAPVGDRVHDTADIHGSRSIHAFRGNADVSGHDDRRGDHGGLSR